LEGLNKLRYLDLSNTEITDESVRALSRLPKLAHLNLSGCKYVRSVKALEGVKTLSSLDISRCADVKTLPDLKRANWQYLCFFNSSDCFSLPESLQIDWDISMWRNGTDISPGAFGRFLEAPEFCSVEVNLFYFNSSTKCVEPKNPRALDDYTFQEALAQGGELSNGLLNWRRIKRLDLSRTCISARSLSDLDKCCRFLVFLDLTECLGLPVAVRRKWLLSNPNSMKDLLDTIRVEAAANHGFMDTIDD
jgi:Leucine-rich repeat (LRR) protein